jgi:tripartite-type tricarboxylate transporter receptor subunit TctC
MNIRVLRWLAFALLAVVCAAAAQEYPDKTVRIVVAYPPGGPADIAARIVAEQLSLQLPQRVIVDNRPGAGGIIGTEVVANTAADGYTLLLSGNNIAIAQALSSAPRYDSTQSFVHVAQIAALPTGVFVSAQSPHATFRDLLAFAKANPDKLTYASGGNGTPSHLAMEMLQRSAGIEVRHIPYKGTPPAVTDLIGGQVDMLVTSIAGPIEQVKAGRLKILAVSSPERLDQLPQVPAIAETLPGYSFETWLAISAPRGTSPAIVQRLAAEIERALKQPALVKRMNDAGLKAIYLSRDGTAARMSAEQRSFAQVIKDANIRAE